MITYSNDSAILSFLMGKLYGCEKLIAGESAQYKCIHYFSACFASAWLFMKAG